MNTIAPMVGSADADGGLSRLVKDKPEQAAKMVESMFTSMLLKEMRSTIGSEDGFAGDPSDTIGGLFDQYMGDHLAESGGIGIADSIRTTLLSGVQK
jgi:flagellar protein FlgJ